MLRCRFTEFQPSAIEAMALSADKRILAIGRQNRNLELWSLEQHWSQVVLVPGHRNCDLRNLHFVNDCSTASKIHCLYYKNSDGKEKKRRILSTGLNGAIIEWDLVEFKPKAKNQVQSPIWHSILRGKEVYLGCEDGQIRIFKARK